MLSKPNIPRDFAIPVSQGISTAVSRLGSEMMESVVPCSAVNGDTPGA